MGAGGCAVHAIYPVMDIRFLKSRNHAGTEHSEHASAFDDDDGIAFHFTEVF
jgi:hypothetical protein